MADSDQIATDVSDGDSPEALSARRAANLIWDDDPAAEAVVDPRTPTFARTFLMESIRELKSTRGLLRKALEGAARGAEGTNVEPFHGIIEVIQNADDLGASVVRLMVAERAGSLEMLLVHNGRPVTCHHVPGMILPYLTTKEDDPDQRGRFGIGLKTLRRISSSMAVHSAPYHFQGGAGVFLSETTAAEAIPGFYEPETDTLLTLGLTEEFESDEFDGWCENWSPDSLIFLERVRRFVRVDTAGELVFERRTEVSNWRPITAPAAPGEIKSVEARQVKAEGQSWRVIRAHVRTTPEVQRAYKSTAETTPVSIASCEAPQHHGLFIGFPTRLATDLPFAIDAQFDPSTAREAIISNGWNIWLIKLIGHVIAHAASSELRRSPAKAWRLVPLPQESAGDPNDAWPFTNFREAFQQAREGVARTALFAGDPELALSDLAWEAPDFTGLFEPEDVSRLTGRQMLPLAFRDRDDRWRASVIALGVGQAIDLEMVLQGFRDGDFSDKPADWWADAGARLTDAASIEELDSEPIWLTTSGAAVACGTNDGDLPPLVLDAALSGFGVKWDLFPRLDPAYRTAPGHDALDRLVASGRCKTQIDALDELHAFALKHQAQPIAVTDDDLKRIRDMLNPYNRKTAARVGARLGAALLIDATETRSGKTLRALARPDQVYLPKNIDKEHPNWPIAAADLPGILWAAQTYEDRLRTGLGKARKGDDGVIVRGARSFLSLLGAAHAPRLIKTVGAMTAPSQVTELVQLGANQVPEDWSSPDLRRAVDAIARMPRKRLKERRERGAALLRALSRDWADQYEPHAMVASEYKAKVQTRPKGSVHANWLSLTRDTAWVSVGSGQLKAPPKTVAKSEKTQAVYSSDDIIVGVAAAELDGVCLSRLGVTADVMVSHLLDSLSEQRRATSPDLTTVRQIYRQLARLTPKSGHWMFGDVPLLQAQQRVASEGLVAVLDQGRLAWRQPRQVMSGPALFPEVERFVLDGDAYKSLWTALAVGAPTVADCAAYLVRRAASFAPEDEIGVLIEVYQFLDSLLRHVGDAGRLKRLPVNVGGAWTTERPVHFVLDETVRAALASALPKTSFWSPPCAPETLANLIRALKLDPLSPSIRAVPSTRAQEVGEDFAERFARAVDHLSDALGKAGKGHRRALSIDWAAFRSLPLFIHDDMVEAEAVGGGLERKTRVRLPALMQSEPLELHASAMALGDRDLGGRAIASLFSRNIRSIIEAEWVVAWGKSQTQTAEALVFRADDEGHAAAMAEAADAANLTSSLTDNKIKLTPPKSRQAPSPMRRLKELSLSISSVTIEQGQPPKPPSPARPPKNKTMPPAAPADRPPAPPLPNTDYSWVDLERQGWDILTHLVLHGSQKELVDFRRTHGVGADGAIDWKTFVELKATGRSPLSGCDLRPSEYARAMQCGNQYILAVVSGLEEGHTTRVKLIFDPCRRATVSETNGVRLTGLIEAAGVVINLADDGCIIEEKT